MEQRINYALLWRCMVLLLLPIAIFPLKSYAVPAYDGLFELNQPSGFPFEARQRGDEWYNWVETSDGYGIYKNMATGNWEYYLPSSQGGENALSGRIQDSPLRAIVGEVDPSSLGIPIGLQPGRTSPDPRLEIFTQKNVRTRLKEVLKTKSVSGTISLLVIGVDYTLTTATYAAGQVQPLLFGSGDSVSDYFRKTSYSSVTITPATESSGTANDGFVGWLRLKGSHPNTGSSIDARNQQIAKDAILAAGPYINYSSYDDNGNGIIEPTELSILIIVSGYEAAYSSASPAVWAHQWYMYSVGYPIVDGKTIQQYAQFGEKHGDHLATFGVMAHELGHLMFTLPDLYDTDTSNGDSFGIGYFDLMGAGSWGAAFGANPGSSPTQLSA
ncbi:MAG: M6 family metalloprotease domain-containing protein [Candidatus Brocadia sp.]